LPADFQLSSIRLSQPLHRQPQHLVFDFDIQYSPDQVPLRRPEMQQALVVFAGDRIFGLRQIK